MAFSSWSDLKNLDNFADIEKVAQNAGTKPGETQENEVEEHRPSGSDKLAEISEMTSWGDTRKLDDDHDSEWFEYKEKELGEKFGGEFITVKYAEHGRVTYYCELCMAECNAMKSLELHCNGMKHLKKKDTWDKDGRHTHKGGLRDGTPTVPPKSAAPNNEPQRLLPRKPLLPPPSFRGYSRNSPPHRPRSPINDRFNDRFNDRGGRSHNDRRRGYSDYPEPREDYGRDRYRRSPSPPRLRYGDPPPDWSGDAHRRQLDEPPRAPAPPSFDKEPLAQSSAGNFILKLSQCCVKTDEDAELALNVVSALIKSMKEYSVRNKEIKISELLGEAGLKVGTIKALKVGMKMLASFTDPAKPLLETDAHKTAPAPPPPLLVSYPIKPSIASSPLPPPIIKPSPPPEPAYGSSRSGPNEWEGNAAESVGSGRDFGHCITPFGNNNSSRGPGPPLSPFGNNNSSRGPGPPLSPFGNNNSSRGPEVYNPMSHFHNRGRGDSRGPPRGGGRGSFF